MERIRISDEEFVQRVKNAQARMRAADIDVMLCFANEAEPQFVRYFSDYWPSFETAAVLFGTQGDPILLIGPESLTYASDRSRIKDIRKVKCLRESSNPEYPGHKLSTLAEAFASVCGNLKTLAVAGYNLMPKIVYDDIEEALAAMGSKARVVRGDELIMELRKIKSPAEIACLRKSGEITVKAMQAVIDSIRPGMTEEQARGIALQSIFANGGESEAYPFWVLTGKGSNQAISRTRSKVIEKNDYAHINVGARYEGYATSLGRQVFFGDYSSWVLDAVKVGYEAMEMVKAELHDGNNAGTVARRYYELLGRTGHDKYTLYGPCHASGLMEGEPPWIESDSDYILHENMCYCGDIFMGQSDGLGLRVENSLRVGKTCAEDFTPFPCEIFRK